MPRSELISSDLGKGFFEAGIAHDEFQKALEVPNLGIRYLFPDLIRF